MENITVKIGERTIPLRFRMDQFRDIEEAVGNLGEVREILLNGKKRIRNLVTTIRILGNAGLKAAGEKPDITEEWLYENMDTSLLTIYQLAAVACMSRESESQAVKEENENKERDLVLEEIEAKKDPVNSHTGA